MYHLSAQFPGPTTPRDFVTLLLTSDQAIKESEDNARHYMVVSKPCIHPDCPPREGFIRGQYESVEFIREIPRNKTTGKSSSTTDLPNSSHTRNRSGSSTLGKDAMLRNAKTSHPEEHEGMDTTESRNRGKTISYAESRGSEAKGENIDTSHEDNEEAESNPVEWIMITRSDPGGSVPRFMVERGTPGSIVSDASKFLDWACSKDMEEFEDDVHTGSASNGGENHEHKHEHKHDKELHDYQTNGHLAGVDGDQQIPVPATSQPAPAQEPTPQLAEENTQTSGGIFGLVAGAVGAAGAVIAPYAPAVITNHLPGHVDEEPVARAGNADTVAMGPPTRRLSATSSSSSSSSSSEGSFASAVEGQHDLAHHHTNHHTRGTLSTSTGDADSVFSKGHRRAASQQEKELQKLEERKRKLDEKLQKTREKELNRKNEDAEKEQAALAKIEEKHQKEIAKAEGKHQKEMAKLEAKKEKEARKAEEKRQKEEAKDARLRLSKELADVKAERDELKKERDLLMEQLGQAQKENTVLVARMGSVGIAPGNADAPVAEQLPVRQSAEQVPVQQVPVQQVPVQQVPAHSGVAHQPLPVKLSDGRELVLE